VLQAQAAHVEAAVTRWNVKSYSPFTELIAVLTGLSEGSVSDARRPAARHSSDTAEASSFGGVKG
jgi:hypothetical protein